MQNQNNNNNNNTKDLPRISLNITPNSVPVSNNDASKDEQQTPFVRTSKTRYNAPFGYDPISDETSSEDEYYTSDEEFFDDFIKTNFPSSFINKKDDGGFVFGPQINNTNRMASFNPFSSTYIKRPYFPHIDCVTQEINSIEHLEMLEETLKHYRDIEPVVFETEKDAIDFSNEVARRVSLLKFFPEAQMFSNIFGLQEASKTVSDFGDKMMETAPAVNNLAESVLHAANAASIASTAVCETINEFGEKITDAFDKLDDRVDTTTEKVESSVARIVDLTKEIGRFFSRFISGSNPIFTDLIVVVSSLCSAVLSSMNTSVLVLSVTNIVAIISKYFVAIPYQSIYDYIKANFYKVVDFIYFMFKPIFSKFFPDRKDDVTVPEAQSFSDKISVFYSFCLESIDFFSIADKFSETTISILKHGANTGRMLTGWKSLFVIAKEVKEIYDDYLDTLGGIDSKKKAFLAKNPDCANLVESVLKFNSSYTRKQASIDQDTFFELETLYNNILRVESRIVDQVCASKNQYNEKYLQYITSLRHLLMPIYTEALKNPPILSGKRTVPYSILLNGPPATYKSLVSKMLSKSIQARYFSTIDKDEDLIYERTNGTAFWEGYNGQPITTLDDFAQKVDIVGAIDSEYIDLIRMVNSAAFLLPKAAVTDKKNAYFTSSFILATTNHAAFPIKSISDTDAVNRRFNIRIRPFVVCDHTNKLSKKTAWTQQKVDTPGKVHNINEKCLLFSLTDSSGNRIINPDPIELTENPNGLPIDKPEDSDHPVHFKNLAIYVPGFEGSSEFLFTYEDMLEYIFNDIDIEKKRTRRFDSILEYASTVAQMDDSSLLPKGHKTEDKNEFFSENVTIHDYGCDLEEVAVSYFDYLILYFVTTSHQNLIDKTLLGKILYGGKGTYNKLAHKFLNISDYYKSDLINDIDLIRSIHNFARLETQSQAIYIQQIVDIYGESVEVITTTHGNITGFIYHEILSKCIELKLVNFKKKLNKKETMLAALLDPAYVSSVLTDIASSISGYFDSLSKTLLAAMENHPFISGYAIGVAIMAIYHGYCYICKPEVPPPNAQGVYYIYDGVEKRVITLESFEQYEEFMEYGGSRYRPFKSNKRHYVYDQSAAPDNTIKLDQAVTTKSEKMESTYTRKPPTRFTHEVKDESAFSTVCTKVQMNMFKLTAYNGERVLGRIFGLFLRGNLAVIPAHFKNILVGQTHYTLQSCDHNGDGYKIKNHEIIFIEKKTPNDFVGFYLTAPLPKKPKITQHFIKRADCELISSFPASLMNPEYTSQKRVEWTFRPITAVKSGKVVYSSNVNQEMLTNLNTVKYVCQNKRGDCGSVLLAKSNTMARRIVGFHIAGAESIDEGYSTIITYEDIMEIETLCPKSAHMYPEFYDFVQFTDLKDMIFEDASEQNLSFTPIGIVPNNCSISNKQVSKLVPTVYYECFGSATKKPAHLTPFINANGDVIDPLNISLRKYLKDTPRLDSNLLGDAVESVADLMSKHREVEYARILNDSEIIYGTLGDEYNEGMALGKSAGYPYCLRGLKKRDLIDPETLLFKKDIMKNIADYEEMLAKGIKFPHFFTTNPKDETIDATKSDNGKVRVFFCASVEFLFLVKKYFGAFVAQQKKHRIRNEQAVGVSPSSLDWTRLFNWLQSKGSRVFAGDFGGFDASENLDITSRIVDIINQWYNGDERDNLIRSTLWSMICNAMIICGNKIFEFNHSIPSGHLLTSCANSLYVQILMRYIFLKVMKGHGTYCTMKAFTTLVALIVYGDDHVVNIADEISRLFNQNTVVEFMKEAGMDYTDENKSTEGTPDYRTIYDVTFLKRKFKQGLGTMLAPLNLSSIDESIYYYKSKMIPQDIMESMTINNLFEYMYHSFDLFLERKSQLQYVIGYNSRGLDIYVPTINEVASTIIFEHTDIIVANPIVVSQMEGPGSIATNLGSIHKTVDDTGFKIVSAPAKTNQPSYTQICKTDTENALSRGIKIASVNFTITNPPGLVISNFVLPSAIVTNPMITNKLKDFRFFRADIKIRVLVNGPPDAAGKCWMYFVPFFSELTNRIPTNTIVNATGYHGVEIDCGSPSTVELEIPYNGILSFHDLVHDLANLGTMKIMVLNTLRTAVATSFATFTIYGSFTNIKLCVPTPNTAIAQMMDEGEEKSTKGIISGIAATTGNIAKIAQNVPELNKPAKTIGWIAEAVGELASMIGFAKPTSIQANQPMCMIPGKGFTNAVGLDNSTSLSAHPDNQIVSDNSVFATDADEMDIRYICKKFNWIASFSWNTDLAENTILYKCPVSPGVCSSELTSNTSYYAPTQLAFVASMFQKWKGSIKFRVSLAKNRYFSGRLSLVYLAGYNYANVLSTVNFDACPRCTIDLTETSSGEISISYLNNTLWANSVLLATNDFEDSPLTQNTGIFCVIVESPLSGQQNVVDTIDGNIWIAGGDDLSFAIPYFGQYIAAYDVTPAPSKNKSSSLSSCKKNKTPVNKIRAQVGNDDKPDPYTNQQEQTKDSKTINITPCATGLTLDGEKYSIGEAVTNLRTLTRRFGISALSTSTQYILDPNWFGDYNASTSGECPIEYISYLYRLQRGSRRYKIICRETDFAGLPTAIPKGYDAWLAMKFNSNPVPPPVASVSGNSFGTLRTIQSFSQNNILELSIPFYRDTATDIVSEVKYRPIDYCPVVYVNVAFDLGTGENPIPFTAILAAGGDDFTFGCLVGAPYVHKIVN